MNHYVLILTHFVSDWILQPRAGAENKTSSWKWMLFHLLIITLCFLIVNLWFGLPIYLILINTILHGIIDKFIWSAFKKFRGPFTEEYKNRNLHAKDYWFYFTIAIDQILHLTILFYLLG